jgi:hypothetical protein
MKEVSNKVVAMLIIVLIITLLLEISVFGQKYNKAITHKAIGFVGFCADNNPVIIPIEDQIAYIDESYTYDVNTTIPNDQNVTFYDNTSLFDINMNTGLIFFTPDEDDEGIYYINITVVSICGVIRDSEIMKLTITHRNRPPDLDPIPDFVINQSELFIYDVNASDPDGDTLFFGDNTTMFQINSNTGVIYFTPVQNDVGNNSVLIWVLDGRGGIDWQVVNFEIIDVNDPPVLQTIGSQTAIINETYTYDVNATDVDVKPEWNSLTFHDNATFFTINTYTGLINFTPTDANNGTYWINISVTDGELGDEEIISFSVIAVNHPPNITSWYPENYTLEINEGESLFFNITKYDPDGTVPSSQWYLNEIPLNGETEDYYYYYTGYTSSGTHNVTVIISDGELTASHEWRVIVRDVPPPPSGVSIPPSGQALPPPCQENWRCSEWSICPVYEIQTRVCEDLNKCGTTKDKPEERRKCIYTPHPNCTDDIINCHDGGCEIWIDCGGPCPPCATCSDGLMNCHKMTARNIVCEEEVDCGGPCPPCSLFKEAVCGDFICSRGELLTCPLDCSLVVAQFLLIALLIGGASVALYRTYIIVLVFYRKRIRPLPYTNLELLGASTLRKLHLIQLEIGKKSLRTIIAEFSRVMRDFFAQAFDIRKKFTYIELIEVARKRKVERSLATRIAEFAIRITEMEYKVGEPSIADLSAAIKNAIAIVEKISGVRLHESLEKRAEGELKKTQPKEEEVKLPPEEAGIRRQYVMSAKDEATIKMLDSLMTECDRLIVERKIDEAEKAYARIRELYDQLPYEAKRRLYAETIRIIKIYNSLTQEIKG